MKINQSVTGKISLLLIMLFAMIQVTYPNPSAGDTLQILSGQSVTWDNSIQLNQSHIRIDSGGMLSVTDTSWMMPGAKIVVMPGGKMIVNGGMLTGFCNWGGIEVWGNPENIQVPAAQGWLSISNGGTVENAVTGVRVGSEDFAGKGGGIVHTDSAFFRNNQTGVLYHDYAGSNIGNFNLTTFETTAELLDGSTPYDLMKLVNVEDITINGCTFRNTRGSTVAYNNRGKGITGIDATFYVDHICTSGTTPCTQYQETEFSKLDYGIYAIATTTTPFADIRETVFTDNIRGIYLSGMTLPRVTSNTFEITRKENLYVYGLYLDQCTDYWVEGNYFEGNCIPGFTPCDEIGIVVNESGYDPNEIYRNDFENVGYGVIAQGLNRNPRSIAGEGLVCKCNEFTGNAFDIVVSGESSPYGIAQHQGSSAAQANAPAGNLFSWTGPTGTDTDIDNQGLHFNYYYHVDEQYHLEPKYYDTLKVTAIPNYDADWDSITSCPSYIDTAGNGGGSSGAMRSLLSTSEQASDSLNNLIQTLEDAGNTESLEWTVDMSVPEHSYQVYNALMNTAPYISDTVMEAAIEKEEVLPDVMLRDVMVASPESAKDDELLQKLEERSNPMPGYMLGQILQGRSLVSAYGDLLAREAYYRSLKAFAIKQLKQAYRADTAGAVAPDSLMALLQMQNKLNAQYELAFLHLQQNDSTAAMELLNQVPDKFILDEKQLGEHNQLIGYFNLIGQINASPIDSTTMEILYTMAGSGTGMSSVYSRNILLAGNAFEYDEPIILPGNTKSAQTEEYRHLIHLANKREILQIQPNPARDHFIATWELEKYPGNLTLRVTSLKGKLVKELQISGKTNQLVMDTGSLQAGIYIVSLHNQGKNIDSKKVSIVN